MRLPRSPLGPKDASSKGCGASLANPGRLAILMIRSHAQRKKFADHRIFFVRQFCHVVCCSRRTAWAERASGHLRCGVSLEFEPLAGDPPAAHVTHSSDTGTIQEVRVRARAELFDLRKSYKFEAASQKAPQVCPKGIAQPSSSIQVGNADQLFWFEGTRGEYRNPGQMDRAPSAVQVHRQVRHMARLLSYQRSRNRKVRELFAQMESAGGRF